MDRRPAGPIAIYLSMLLVGAVLHYALQMMFLIPAFWMQTSEGLREIFWSLDQCTSRPHGIFSGWVRRMLVSILPLSLIVSFPAQALFTGLTAKVLLHVLGVTAAAFAFMVWLWRRGLRAYGSASS